MIGIDLSLGDVSKCFKKIWTSLTYRQKKHIYQLQKLHVSIEQKQCEPEMYRKLLSLLHRQLPPLAQDGWISVQRFDEHSRELLPHAIYPPLIDPDMHANVFRSLSYDLKQPTCCGVVADCARKALEWETSPSAEYPGPIIVNDVKDYLRYRLIDPQTKSEAAVAVFWGSHPLGVLNFESKRASAFKGTPPLLNAIARTVERFYALYRGSTVGCENSIEQLLHLSTDPCPNPHLLLQQVCRIVAMAVVPNAKVAYLGVWDGGSFNKLTRGWCILADRKIITPHLQNLELSPDGLSSRVLETGIPLFDLRANMVIPSSLGTSSDETLHYMLKMPFYHKKSKGKRSCSVLPLYSQGRSVGVLWLLFERDKTAETTDIERTHLSCIATFAGSIVGASIEGALRRRAELHQFLDPYLQSKYL